MVIKGKTLKQVTSLNLSGKGLSDIPKEVFECTNLRKLNLANNHINHIPLEIHKLRKLEVLNLTGNQLTQLHGGLFKLTKLKRLVLVNNSIKSIPLQIENLTQLEVLMVQNNKLNSLNASCLTQKIRKLNISNNQINDLSWLSHFPNLKQLWIGGNPISEQEINLLIHKSLPYKLYHNTKKDFLVSMDNSTLTLQKLEDNIQPHSIKETKEKVPVVCISYTWDDEAHKEWVLNLANRLRDNGIETLLDRFHLRPGCDKNKFMEDMISKSERALVILTPEYKRKADNRIGGAGYEYSLITSEVFKQQSDSKFIPILRKATMDEACPKTLEPKIAIFMREEDNFEEKLDELCREIYDQPKIQPRPVGRKPQYI